MYWITDDELIELQNEIKLVAEQVRQHEFEIINIIFEEGKIPSVTDTQMRHFVEPRTTLVLQYLGLEKLYDVKYDPISSWFYSNINAPTLVDFFNRNATSYTRDWNENRLSWDSE